jgi:hypothetical protein
MESNNEKNNLNLTVKSDMIYGTNKKPVDAQNCR